MDDGEEKQCCQVFCCHFLNHGGVIEGGGVRHWCLFVERHQLVGVDLADGETADQCPLKHLMKMVVADSAHW